VAPILVFLDLGLAYSEDFSAATFNQGVTGSRPVRPTKASKPSSQPSEKVATLKRNRHCL